MIRNSDELDPTTTYVTFESLTPENLKSIFLNCLSVIYSSNVQYLISLSFQTNKYMVFMTNYELFLFSSVS